MKAHPFLVLGIALLLTWASGSAQAQPPGDPLPGGFPMIVVVDEFCSGSWSQDGGDTFTPLDCFIDTDPISGIMVPAFVLPQPVVAGDVIALEITTGGLSDMLRFPDLNGDGTSDRVYFFSDIDPVDQAPSDVGIPDQFQHNVVRVFEQGTPELFDFFLQSTPSAVYLAISDYPIQRASERGLAQLIRVHATPR